MTIVALIVLSGLAGVFFPWKTYLAHTLKSALEARGIPDADFTISEITPRGAVFQDIAMGRGRPFTLKNLTLQYSPRADEISANAEGLRVSTGGLKANAAQASVHAKNGEGDWRLQDLQGQAGSVILPAITGGGKFKYSSDALLVFGQFKSEDKSYVADFILDYPLAHPENAQLNLIYATAPWKGGALTVRNVLIPLNSEQPVKLALEIRQVSTDALLQAMTGKRVAAAGTISGALPLIISRKGEVSLGEGLLRADGAGRISMPSDAIPEGNEKVTIVRDILKNFHYQGLSMSVNSDKSGVSILVALEGNNPDMYNGRPVKLNVRLAGDVLGYIRQNVLLLTSPETLLRQDQK